MHIMPPKPATMIEAVVVLIQRMTERIIYSFLLHVSIFRLPSTGHRYYTIPVGEIIPKKIPSPITMPEQMFHVKHCQKHIFII